MVRLFYGFETECSVWYATGGQAGRVVIPVYEGPCVDYS